MEECMPNLKKAYRAAKKPSFHDCTKMLSQDVYTEILGLQNEGLLQPMVNCLTTNDITLQCRSVKEIGGMFSKGISADHPHKDLVFKALTQMYLQCEPKICLKRSIASAFESIPEVYHPRVIRFLKDGISDIILKSTSVDDAVDVVLAALENVPIGSRAVSCLLHQVFDLLNRSLAGLVSQLRDAVGASQVALVGQKCQTTSRTATLFLRQNETLLRQGPGDSAMVLMASQLLGLLATDGCSVDCCANCGMALSLLILIIAGNCDSILEHGFGIPVSPPESKRSDELNFLTTLKSLGPIPRLSLIKGMLCTLNIKELSKRLPGTNHSLVHFFLDEIIAAEARAQSGVAVVTSRLLLLWTQKSKEMVKVYGSVVMKVGEGDAMCSQLLEYVGTHWGHFVDSVRYVTKDIFRNVLELHVALSNEDAKTSRLVWGLAENAVALPWHDRGKFCVLGVLVDYLGLPRILGLAPSLPVDLLRCMEDANLAPYAIELHEKLLYTHEMSVNRSGQNDWEQTWIRPLVTAIVTSANPVQFQGILPKLLKRSPETFAFLKKELQLQCSPGVMLLVVKTARTLGVAHTSKWNDVIPKETLISSILGRDTEVQLAALGLLCECPRTTELPSREDLEILRDVLPYLVLNHSTTFRQSLLALIKKLIMRLRDGVQVSKDQEDGRRAKEFLSWMGETQFSCLVQSVNHVRRGTALSILQLLQNLIGFQNPELEHCLSTQNVQTLLECLKDPYEINKSVAVNVLTSLTSEQLGFDGTERTRDLFECGLHLARKPRPTDSVTAAYLLRLLVRHELTGEIAEKMYKALTGKEIIGSWECVEGNVYATLRVLMVLLEKRECVTELRMKFGVICCARFLIQDVDLGCVGSRNAWRSLLEEIVDLCLEIGEDVGHIVNNDSPEGNLPVEFVEDENFMENSKGHVAAAQMFLVCGWRTMKEISLLLGDICHSTVMISADSCSQVISTEHIMKIGEYFVKQLGEMKHRGAFEQTYVGFCRMCETLWRCTHENLHIKPQEWLEGLLKDLRTGDGNLNFCSTRRSAGLPYMFQAILSSEPDVTGESCIKKAMRELLEMSACGNSADDTKVHVMNILRALFRDARLGESVVKFVADGLKISILGFNDNSWAVRNAATLLFSALVTRIFGVKRSREESCPKNRMSSKTFFQRFPVLHQFLLGEVREAATQLADNINAFQPSLYPILTVLARLDLHADTRPSHFSLEGFVPYVSKCGSSRVMKTRVLAAKTMVSIIPRVNYPEVVLDLVNSLPDTGTNQNVVHGILLQIKFLLGALASQENLRATDFPRDFSNAVVTKLWIGTRENPCHVTRTVFLEIVTLALESGFDQSGQKLSEQVRGIVNLEFGAFVGSRGYPGISEFRCQVAKLKMYFDLRSSSSREMLIGTFRDMVTGQGHEVRGMFLSRVESVLSSGDFGDWKFLNTATGELTSRAFMDVLVEGLTDELQHPDCLIKICNILAILKLEPNCEWRVGPAKDPLAKPSQKLEFVLWRLEREKRDEVKCSLLRLSGNLLRHVYDEEHGKTTFSSHQSHPGAARNAS